MIYGQRTRGSVAHALCLSYYYHLQASEQSVEFIGLFSDFGFLSGIIHHHSDTAEDIKISLARVSSGSRFAHRLRHMYLNWNTWRRILLDLGGESSAASQSLHKQNTFFNDLKISRLTTRKGKLGL